MELILKCVTALGEVLGIQAHKVYGNSLIMMIWPVNYCVCSVCLMSTAYYADGKNFLGYNFMYQGLEEF
jgi:hypothetical protein